VPDPTSEWLAVGRVRKPHGVRGELLVDIVTDFPERLVAGIEVGLGGDDGPDRTIAVEEVRHHKQAWIVRLGGVGDRDGVESLRGLWVFLPPQPRSELPENFFYEHELVGCRVEDTRGETLGTVQELTPAPGQSLLLVRVPESDRTFLLPFVSPIVVRVDLEHRRVVADPPEGLLDVDAL
jgi:16S rRNA processing protein RimM